MHRRGVTLTEVLVAIFVSGLGLMALMTLFPLGAMNMAQAIKDDRCGIAAANAASVLRAYWRVSLETGGKTGGANGGAAQPDPVWGGIEASLAKGPVFIDPIGYIQYNGTALAGVIPRMTLDPNKDFTHAARWCWLADDINFNPNGTPVVTGEIQRQGYYTWAWMVRWLKSADPNGRARALDFDVVVYHNRSMSQSGGLTPLNETALSASFAPAGYDDRTVIVTYGGNKPQIRKGSWILDATMQPTPQGFFYRVESVRDTGSTLILGVQMPFRGGPAAYQGTIVFMDSVAEVFPRSTLE